MVTYIKAEPGQVVKTGEVICQIADPQLLEVLVAVPESRMLEVHLNAPIRLRLWSAQQANYSGLVREISPSADSATRAFNIRISIQNPDDKVKLGMTAQVKFIGQEGSPAGGLLIPSSALTELDGKPSVWVIDANNQAQPRTVVTGQYSENGITVVDGLQAGDKIAIAGVHTLVQGQVVKPVLDLTP